LKVIQSLDQIPVFQDDDAEFDYWATHRLSDLLLERMGPLPGNVLPPARTRPISLRLDEDVLRRLKALSKVKQKGYQSLMKEFLVERLYEEERRHGILSRATGAHDAPEHQGHVAMDYPTAPVVVE